MPHRLITDIPLTPSMEIKTFFSIMYILKHFLLAYLIPKWNLIIEVKETIKIF